MAPDRPLFRLHDGAATDPASVLLVQLNGFVDAGHCGRLIVEHILATHRNEVVGEFEVDQLLDYRGRRPVMVFDKDRWTSYDAPELVLRRVYSLDGTPFLVLTGPEPDFQWERVVGEIAQVVQRFNVDLTVSVHGIPMAVPHTRPLGLTAHGTTTTMLPPAEQAFSDIQVPASFSALMEYRFGQAGRDVLGAAIHVPHYLAQAEYAQGALVGINQLTAFTGLDLDTAALASAARENLAQIGSELAGNDEATALVAALERQYDAFQRGRELPGLLATDVGPVPSADEIGAELEAYLKDVTADPPATDEQG